MKEQRTYIIKNDKGNILLALKKGTTRRDAYILYRNEYRANTPWSTLIEIREPDGVNIQLADPTREKFMVYAASHSLRTGKQIGCFEFNPFAKDVAQALEKTMNRYRSYYLHSWNFMDVSVKSLFEIDETIPTDSLH